MTRPQITILVLLAVALVAVVLYGLFRRPIVQPLYVPTPASVVTILPASPTPPRVLPTLAPPPTESLPRPSTPTPTSVPAVLIVETPEPTATPANTRVPVQKG